MDIPAYVDLPDGTDKVIRPFSPYSDINVKETSLRSAIKSPLFKALQSGDLLKDDHDGGCVLYEKRRQVEELISGSSI